MNTNEKIIDKIKAYVTSPEVEPRTGSNFSIGYTSGISHCKSTILNIIHIVENYYENNNDDFDNLKEFQLMANDICQRLLTNTPVEASLLQEFADSANLVLNCFNAVKATMLAFPPEIVQDLNSHFNILNYGKHNVNSDSREG